MHLPTKRSILFAALWIAVGFVLLAAVIYLTIFWNLFSWGLNGDMPAVTLLSIVLLSVSGVFHLAKRTKENLETWIALIVALALAIFGIALFIEFHNEVIDSSFLGRRVLSPHWFHLLVLTVLLLPGLCWLYFPFQHWISKASR